MLLPQGQEGLWGGTSDPKECLWQCLILTQFWLKANQWLRDGGDGQAGWLIPVFPEETRLKNESPSSSLGLGSSALLLFLPLAFCWLGDTNFFPGNNFSQSIFSLDREAEMISRVISSPTGWRSRAEQPPSSPIPESSRCQAGVSCPSSTLGCGKGAQPAGMGIMELLLWMSNIT